MFDAALVVIEADVPAHWLQVAVESCNAALGAGRCLAGGKAFEQAWPQWRAQVSGSSDDPDTWRVEFGQSSVSESPLLIREMHFADSDGSRERWITVGVVIAALVVAQDPRHEGTGPAAPPPSPDPGPAPPQKSASRSARVSLGAGLATSIQANNSPVSLGPALIANLRLGIPVVFTGYASYTRSYPDQYALEFWSGAAGAGLYFSDEAGGVSAQLAAEMVAQRASVTASDFDSNADARRSATRLGFGLDVLGQWHFSPRMSLGLGAQLASLSPRIDISVRGQDLDTVGNSSATLYLSLAVSSD